MLIISKLVSFLLSPAHWLYFAVLILLLVRNKKWKKRMAVTAIAVLLVFSNPLLFRWAYQAWEVKQPALSGSYDAVILPGGMADYDLRNQGHFNYASDRFIQAALLYHSGKAPYIIVTGGNGFINRDIPPEALFLKTALETLQVPPDRIITETRSRNTRENALYTREKADSLALKGPMILVTSAMHMRRCLEEFGKAGLTIVPYSCNYEVLDTDAPFYDHLWPDVSLLQSWGRLFKEWIGWTIAHFRK